MTDIAQLVMAVESAQAVRAEKSLDNLTAAAKKTESATERMRREAEQANGRFRDMDREVQTITRTLGGLAAALGITFSVREIVDYSNRWTDLNSKLVNATGSQEEADRAMQGLARTARTTYSGLEMTAEAFLRNNMTLTELGYTTRQQIDLSDALNNSLVISGTKGIQAESVMNALSKAFATGSLRGENFNTVVASGGRMVQALADGLGVGTLELRAMAEEGELTTSRVFNALISQMGKLRDEADAMPATIGDAFGQIGNSLFMLIGRTDGAAGATSALADELVDVADALALISESVKSGRLESYFEWMGWMTLPVRGFAMAVRDVAAATMELVFGLEELKRLKDVIAELETMEGLAITQSIESAAHNVRVHTAELEELQQKSTRLGGISAWMYADDIEETNERIRVQNEIIRLAIERRAELINQQLDEMFRSETEAGKRAGETIYKYGEDVKFTTQAHDAHVIALGEYRKSLEESDRLQAKNQASIQGMRDALENERKALGMTAREQYLFNMELQLLAYGAAPDAIEEILALAGANYDLAEAQEAARGRTEALARESERAAAQMADDWRETRQAFGEFFADMVQDGESAFDALLQSFERMLLEMAGQLALSGILDAFNVNVPGSKGGLSGILDSSGTAGSVLRSISGTSAFDKLMRNTGIDSMREAFSYTDDAGNMAFQKDLFLEGAKTLGLNIVGAYAGGKAGNALGESIFSKEAESNIAQTIGTAIGTYLGGPIGSFIGSTIGSMIDVAAGGDGYVRQNAGMLVGNTPGAKPGHTFEVAPFASGLQVTGFARREDQATAKQLIDKFSNIDSVFTSLVRDLGGSLHVTSLAGLNQEATPGSSGTYLGTGRDADIVGQVNWFVDQLADHVTGLDEALLESIRSAGTAEGVIRLLNDELERQSKLEAMDGLTSSLNAIQRARDQFNADKSLLSVYQQSNDAVRSLTVGYQGTIEQTMALTQAVQAQQEAAYGLTSAYLETQVAVDRLFGGLTESIRTSLMGQEELYEYERSQVHSLTGLLGTLTDPEAIFSTAQEIERRVAGMWSRLEEGSRVEMGQGYLDYLAEVQATAQDRLSLGLASMEKTQADLNTTLLSAAQTAAEQFMTSSQMSLQASENILRASQIDLQAAQINAAAARNGRGVEANA